MTSLPAAANHGALEICLFFSGVKTIGTNMYYRTCTRPVVNSATVAGAGAAGRLEHGHVGDAVTGGVGKGVATGEAA